MHPPETHEDPAERPPLSPLEGGRWRPVRPEELLRRGDATPSTSSPTPSVKPTLERRQELERYLRDRPADIDSYLELAAIYRDAGRSAEATRVLKQALEVEQDHPLVLWQLEEASLARALQQLRDVREVAERLHSPQAQRELERAQVDWANRRADVCRARLARDPSLMHLHVVLAEALRDLGQNDEAIEAVRPALEDDTEAPLAYLIYGNCLQAVGQDLEALAAWRACALRRAVPAPRRIRAAALRSAVDLAERLGLHGSLPLYRQSLRQCEAEAAGRGEAEAADSAGELKHRTATGGAPPVAAETPPPPSPQRSASLASEAPSSAPKDSP